jgi:metal-sulfur cluster biosynthetic enzyme
VVLEWALKKILMRSFKGQIERLEAARSAKAQQSLPAGLIEKARLVEEILSEVEVPGFDVDLMSSGAVKRIRVSRDGSAVAVFIDLSGSDPSCYYCKFINWNLWQSILRSAEERLRKAGFREVVFVDWATGARIEYKAEG